MLRSGETYVCSEEQEIQVYFIHNNISFLFYF